MKRILYYLFLREKIVITKEGDLSVLRKYDCFLGFWTVVFEVHQEGKNDYLLQYHIDQFGNENYRIKIIDKRFEPNTYYSN